MTRNETEKAIEIMQAFVDGKKIEWFNEDHWEEITDPSWEWDEDNPQYRIKPEPHYRPFESAEEVMATIKEHGDWIRRKEDGKIMRLMSFDDVFLWIGLCLVGLSYEGVFYKFTFIDGTPFGKLED